MAGSHLAVATGQPLAVNAPASGMPRICDEIPSLLIVFCRVVRPASASTNRASSDTWETLTNEDGLHAMQSQQSNDTICDHRAATAAILLRMTATSLHTAQFQQLLLRWRSGDQQALNELFVRVDERLQKLARQMLRGFRKIEGWAEAEDVLQNASLRLLRSLQQIDPPSMKDFYALVALQMRRELLDLTRHYFGPLGHAAHLDGREYQVDAPPDPADETHEPSALAQWREFHEQISRLPPDELEIVNLLYYQGLTQVEAAEVLGVHVRTIQRRWHSALVTLAPMLNQLRSTS